MERLERLFQFLRDNPGDDFVLFAIAREYDTRGDLEKAMAYYLQLIEKAPDYVGTYYHLGKLYEKKEAFGEALKTYGRGMEAALQAGDRHAYNELAGARLALGDEEDI